MLLQVDCYPHTYKVPIKGPLKPSNTLFCSPNTVNTSTNSLLLVGRKDADATFVDKSVSRQHLNLILLSSLDQVEGAKEPTTQEQQDACAAGNGTAILLQDSSKFGTFVVIEDATANSAKKDADESATDGDETDNEAGAKNNKSSPQLSDVSKRLVDKPSNATVQKVQADAPLLLTPLLSSRGRVIVQCGQNGSTLVITRLNLNLAFTRVDKTTRQQLTKQAQLYLGATVAGDKDICFGKDHTITHLIAKDRITNGKSLSAWLCGTPIVTVDYLQALLERKNLADAMPKESDFEPKTSKNETFWTNKPNPRLWNKCTLLSIHFDDMETLCRAAGANIVQLYESGSTQKQVFKMIDKSASIPGCFFINITSSKYTKIVSHLKKANVPYVTQKLLASCASKQEPLKNVQEQVIGEGVPTPPSSQDEEAQEDGEEEAAAQEPDFATATQANAETQFVSPSHGRRRGHAQEQHLPVVQEEDKDESEKEQPKKKKRGQNASDEQQQEEETVEPPKKKSSRAEKKDQKEEEEASKPKTKRGRAAAAEEEEEVAPEPKKKRGRAAAASQEEEVEATKPKKKRGRAASQEEEQKEAPEPKKKRGRAAAAEEDQEQEEATKPKKKRGRSASEEDEASQKKEKKRSRRDDAKEKGGEEEEISQLEIIEQEDSDHEEPTGPRKKLRQTSNGWFVAAPKSKKERKAFRQPKDKIKEKFDGDTLPPVAPTGTCKGLIVGVVKQKKTTASRPARAGVKNFKAFRKNSVPQTTAIIVHLRSVLPKESEQQRQKQREEEQLQKEKRIADALFQDRGGGIRSHFSTKKSRKRRDV